MRSILHTSLRLFLVLVCSATLVRAEEPPSQVPPGTQPGGPAVPGKPERPGATMPETPPGVQPGGVPIPIQPGAPQTGVTSAKPPTAAVRVNVTNQSFNFFQPWEKRQVYSRRALGAILSNKRILVTAELVANATLVELEKAESGEKAGAEIEFVDYDANLALLKCTDDSFLSGFKPLEVRNAEIGDHAQIWQLETTGALLSTSALLTTVEVGRYPIDDTSLLLYKLSAPLQYRDSSFTVPVVKDNRLIGMLMRYDARTQTADAVPAPVIQHFLKDASNGNYRGFPRAGLGFSATRDPQFRRYLGLTDKTPGGVYVSEVLQDSPAGDAGIKEGDVVLAIADRALDQDGNYVDKVYGRTGLTHLISTLQYDGDTAKFKVFRKGEILNIDVKLRHRDPKSYVIEPYTIDRAPKFFIIGGLVVTELSRQYLKEWGPEWGKKAPERFLYYDRYQSELFTNGTKRIVILSQVLPSPVTLGYERMASLRITRINDVELKSIDDVPGALAKPVNGFHKIEFDEFPKVIYLDASQMAAAEAELVRNYGLPALRNLD